VNNNIPIAMQPSREIGHRVLRARVQNVLDLGQDRVGTFAAMKDNDFGSRIMETPDDMRPDESSATNHQDFHAHILSPFRQRDLSPAERRAFWIRTTTGWRLSG